MNKSNHRNSFSADQVGYFGKPFYTQEALEIEVARNKKIQELGIIEHHFGSGGKDPYTDDEKEALRLIYADKEVPQELADRIKEYHKKNDKYKKKYKMKVATPKQIYKLLGIKELERKAKQCIIENI